MGFENYYLYRLGIFLVGLAPAGLSYFVAGVFAELNFLFNPRSRRGVWANQRRVLPPDTSWFKRWRTARAAFRHFAYAVIDFFRIPTMTTANKDRFIDEVRGWEHIEAAQQAGVGGIFVTIHMGSWELAGGYVGLKGVPITAAVLPHKDARIEGLFTAQREATGMEPVPIGGALAKLGDAVRRQRFVALLADRDVRGKGPILPFFGEPTHMPDGHAFLAMETGAWLIPVSVYRLRNWKLVIDFRAPIIPHPETDTQEGLALRCIPHLEDFIRAHPEQWFSFYDLWDMSERPVA